MRSCWWAMGLAMCLVGCGEGPSVALPTVAADQGDEADKDGEPEGSPPTIEELAAAYEKKLQLITPEPVYVNPELAMLCRGAGHAEVERARKTSGPHAHTAVRIFMDDLAKAAFETAASAYPVGAVVVKEKSALSHWAEGDATQWAETHDGVGGMVKRAPGYDPVHGDWEYFYFEVEDPGSIEAGRIASCVGCHAGARDTDHVFGTWRKGPAAEPPVEEGE